jgi:alpha/beta superfamily hydrolase
MPKDVVVPDIAEWYNKRGFTCLIFDTFGIGASDGEPRYDVRPLSPHARASLSSIS